MFERLWSWCCTYVLGVTFLCFCWSCCWERLTVDQIVRPVVICFACILGVLFVWGMIGLPAPR